MKNSLIFLTVSFSLGMVYVYFFKVDFWVCYIICLFLIASCLFLINKGLIFDLLLVALIFILGALCLKNDYIISRSGISRYAYYRNDTPYAVRGFINSSISHKNGYASFSFKAEELQFESNSYKTCGDILVYVKAQEELSYGEELILFGKLKKPYPLSRGRTLALMRVKNSFAVVRLNRNKGNLFKKFAFYLKDEASGVFKDHLSCLAASVNSAMILGERRVIPIAVYDSMFKSGTVHIMVVSGFHVGLVAFISGLTLRILRIRRKLRCSGVIFFLVLYCFITGASIPVVRATVMAIFLTLGYFFRREQDISSAIFLSALFILISNSRDIFSISFQLSFSSVIAIVYLYPCFKRLFKTEKIGVNFLRIFVESLFVSLSAWIGTCGFIAYYFKIFSPVTVLANIFIIPAASLIIISGLCMVLLSKALPFTTAAFASFNELSVFILLKSSFLFANLPFAYFRV